MKYIERSFGKKLILAAAGVILAGGIISGCSKKVNDNSEKYVDLASYYGVENDEQYGIVVEGNPVGTAVEIDEKIYLPQSCVASSINSRFFYDKENNQIRYTTPTETITTDVDGSDKKAVVRDGQVYLELTYVMGNSEVIYSMEENPNRIAVFTEMGNINTFSANGGIKLRKSADGSSEIMTDIEEGQLLFENNELVTETVGSDTISWRAVITESGILGYVRTDEISAGTSVHRKSSYEAPEYTHITREDKICLGWQLMTNDAGNDLINDKINGADGLNVISPTWFTVADGTGEITSFASKAYVNTAHNNGIEVWALVNDFEADESGNYYILQVLGSTQARTNLINNLIEQADKYGIDGINVDFEKISLEYGKAYVQFIRELSVACRAKGIVLSADLYVPMSYNQYYGRKDIGEVLDYVIVMGYDEHWAGGDSAGSVASISFVTNGINNTIKDVEASRVINAIPFYTRIWSEAPEDKSDGSGVFVEDSVNGNYYLGSKAVGMSAAENALKTNGVETYWMEDIGQYYGEYKTDGVLYRVWLEEERSVELKLNVMENAGLGGVACWQLGFEKDEIWTVIKNYLNK